jgi:hypothetical protein
MKAYAVYAERMIPRPTGAESDKRSAKRYSVRLAGRYLLPDRTEWDCQSVDLSTTGVLLRGQARPYHGQIVVAYLAEIGRIEGRIVRLRDDEFALCIQTTERKRQQLSVWLQRLANGESVPRRLDPAVLEKAAERSQASPQPPEIPAVKAPPAAASDDGYRKYLKLMENF